MNEGTHKQLEAKLREIISQLDQATSKKTQSSTGNGNIIRRRKGEKDRRFSNLMEPGLSSVTEG